MYNILPQVSEKIRSKGNKALVDWKPANADPTKAKVSKVLQQEFTVLKEEVIKLKYNIPPKREPNYCPPQEAGKADPSPINTALRGIPDEPIIVYKPPGEVSVKAKFAKMAQMEKSNRLICKIASMMPCPMDLFVQRKQGIINTMLTPERSFLKEIGTQIVASNEEVQSTAPFTILCTTASLATVVTTNRQEIKDFTFFTHHRIGMEVEYVNDRLICTKVIPATQAAFHSEELDSAIIIGINNKRVLTLEEFQEEMLHAKRHKHVVLTMAVYKGGKGKTKVDELYILNNAKNETVKNLLSNMFGGGNADGAGGRRFLGSLSTESQSTADDDEFTRASRDESADENATGTDEGDTGGEEEGNGTGDEGVLDDKTRKEKERERLRREMRESKNKKKREKEYKSHSRRHSYRRDSDSDEDDDDSDDNEDEYGGHHHSAEEKEGRHHDHAAKGEKSHTGYSFLDSKNGDDHVPGIEVAADKDYDTGEDGDGLIASKRVIMRDLDIHLHDDPADDKGTPREIQEDQKHLADDVSLGSESQDSWNYMTGVEIDEKAQLEQVFPYTSLVCIPIDASPGNVSANGHGPSSSDTNARSLIKSSTWGNPNSYLQFSNFSTQWKVEVYWVDEEGGLILRHEVKSGQTHFELCSHDHVWVVMASTLAKHNPYHGRGGSSHGSTILGGSGHHLDGGPSMLSNTGISSLGTGGVSSMADVPPVITIFRPSRGALQDGKCASVIWSPWTSLSLSQTMYSKVGKLGSANRSGTPEVRIEPAIHMQVFDSAKKELLTAALHGVASGGASGVHEPTAISEENLGKLRRRPLRKSRNMKM